MSIQVRLKVEADVDEDSDLIELLEELYAVTIRLGMDVESSYLGDKVCVDRRGHAFIPANEGGQRFYRRTARRGWVTREKEDS